MAMKKHKLTSEIFFGITQFNYFKPTHLSLYYIDYITYICNIHTCVYTIYISVTVSILQM